MVHANSPTALRRRCLLGSGSVRRELWLGLRSFTRRHDRSKTKGSLKQASKKMGDTVVVEGRKVTDAKKEPTEGIKRSM